MEQKFRINDIVKASDGDVGTVTGIRLTDGILVYFVKSTEDGRVCNWGEAALEAYTDPVDMNHLEIKRLETAVKILTDNLQIAEARIENLRKRAEEAEMLEDRIDTYNEDNVRTFLRNVKETGINEIYIDENSPWRIMVQKNTGGIFALAEKADHGSVGDGDRKQALDIVNTFNAAVKLSK